MRPMSAPRCRHGLVVFLVAVLAAFLAGRAQAWDSSKWNPTHPTHTYLTAWAIDQLKARCPELAPFRTQIVEGANQELHELPVGGTMHGVDLEAARVQHKGTNEGTDDIQGWWQDSLAAYRAGDKEKAYFLLGVMLHMVEDMGVPAHAKKIHHQGSATEFDNFEFMALSNWKPSFADIDRTDPAYAEPWKYYGFSRDWTLSDAPDYDSPDDFSKTWTFASAAERKLLSNRQGRTAHVVMWAVQSACVAFAAN